MILSKQQEAKIQSLLQEMTLEEKIGQMNLASVSIVGGFDVPFEELIEMVGDGRLSNEEFGKIMQSAERDVRPYDRFVDAAGSGKGKRTAENCG